MMQHDEPILHDNKTVLLTGDHMFIKLWFQLRLQECNPSGVKLLFTLIW